MTFLRQTAISFFLYIFFAASLLLASPSETVKNQIEKPILPPANQVMNSHTTNTPIDFIWVIDDSLATQDNLERLAQKISTLFEYIKSKSWNFQMCITTTDVDYYKGRPLVWSGENSHLLKPSTKSGQDFSQTLVDLLPSLNDDEQAIKAVSLLIHQNKDYNCIRPNSIVSINILSAKDERHSGGSETSKNSLLKPLEKLNLPQAIFDSLDILKKNNKVNVNSIIVADKTCELHLKTLGKDPIVGTQYLKLSEMSHGYIGNQCEFDYGVHLQAIAKKIEEQL